MIMVRVALCLFLVFAGIPAISEVSHFIGAKLHIGFETEAQWIEHQELELMN
jgi:hypothetical protein